MALSASERTRNSKLRKSYANALRIVSTPDPKPLNGHQLNSFKGRRVNAMRLIDQVKHGFRVIPEKIVRKRRHRQTDPKDPCLHCGGPITAWRRTRYCSDSCLRDAFRHPGLSAPERYWQKVQRLSPRQCWPWTGLVTKSTGYGLVIRNGKQLTAHRYGYILTHGAILDGFDVDHVCRNKLCQNPAHLRLLSHADHARMHALERHAVKPGTFSPATS